MHQLSLPSAEHCCSRTIGLSVGRDDVSSNLGARAINDAIDNGDMMAVATGDKKQGRRPKRHKDFIMRRVWLLVSIIQDFVSLSSAFVFLHHPQTSLQRHFAARQSKPEWHIEETASLVEIYFWNTFLYTKTTSRLEQQRSLVDADFDNMGIRSNILGDVVRLGGEDDSFLNAMAVPTFASLSNVSVASPANDRARGLEGALRQGPAFVLDNVLAKNVCENLIETFEEIGFGSYYAGKNHHGALQILVSQATADSVATTLSCHIDVSQIESGNKTLVYAGLNRRWRIYRYAPGGEETFAPHIDAAFPPSGLDEKNMTLTWDDCHPDQEVVSRLTVLIYLNDDFEGGETKFYEPVSEAAPTGHGTTPLIASVRPVAGSVLVFPQAVGEEAVEYARQHWPLHEGAPVVSGNRPKYVIRSDVLFATQADEVIRKDEVHLFEHDSLVRKTFLPRSSALDQNFLSHLSSLYNPHMGVENLGTFLYSFVRFTKVKAIVEIGAGYTSLWILQALKDNNDELDRIRALQRQGKCRLLDWPWTVLNVVERYDDSPASLLCIDNCLHQKETATGAAAVAQTLGLDAYMKFIRGDAFELELEDESVDLLWCDFGVGSRMQEFVAEAWSSIRPGGFLLCHSTLTNQRTRDWLEAARAKKGEAETGMPADEYVELSLLEPHKQYQNSISIFQKRKGLDGKDYNEPLYSEYA